MIQSTVPPISIIWNVKKGNPRLLDQNKETVTDHCGLCQTSKVDCESLTSNRLSLLTHLTKGYESVRSTLKGRPSHCFSSIPYTVAGRSQGLYPPFSFMSCISEFYPSVTLGRSCSNSFVETEEIEWILYPYGDKRLK